MALALEEMGITRYGDDTKCLFKNKPCPDADVYTMKPITDYKLQKPAKYIMITGDQRLSPNNNNDINVATSINNINGDKIKIVLISKAGSEGIDLKNIRQIHIMDPWYNMNRIEQIIGRGVRNLSHKDLPFEERNVEIFLHGTILDNEEDESIDLYIYRVAEIKARQIGKITRILKENSVDCIINNEQTNFTEEKINDILSKNNVVIKQILSSNKIIPDYKIGDKPYSSTCDYMENCNYGCNAELGNLIIKEDTYNESFIKNNSDKIIQKIKLLMKERFFYKKEDLIRRINIPRPYQITHIYYALTQMIEDSSNYIIDKYGRYGYLVNIGNYYLYQPSELNNKNISTYYRSVPINYKNQKISFNTSSDIFEKIYKIKKEEVEEDTDVIKLKETKKKIIEEGQEVYEKTEQKEKEESMCLRGVLVGVLQRLSLWERQPRLAGPEHPHLLGKEFFLKIICWLFWLQKNKQKNREAEKKRGENR
jgi:hypothetical protein